MAGDGTIQYHKAVVSDIDEQEVPDIYVDGLQVFMSPFDITLKLSLGKPEVDESNARESDTVAIVRMSLEHAKLMTMLLKNVLKQHEKETGQEIALHPHVYRQGRRVKKEDW